jgi:pimeloyl-ACP methyl ester carboxylesterase
MRVALPGGAGELEVVSDGPASGPLVLCLHGFPDTPFGYRALTRRLADAGFRTAAPYMRGYHPSSLGGPYHLDRLGDDVIGLADALGGGAPVHVIGHDWGAMAAYVALHRSPGRFARAVLMAVPHPQALLANLADFPGQLRMSWYMGFFNLGAGAERRAAANDFELIERLWARWSPGFRPDDDYLAELKRCLTASFPAPLEYYRALFRPVREAWRRAQRRLPIDTPTLYLHGERDGCISPRMMAGQGRFYRARLAEQILPACGHFLHVERPDVAAPIVVDWLTSRG